jgi:hypothetical protein
VIAFIIETSAATQDMEAEIRDAFAASGSRLRTQTPGTAWLTLGEMLAVDQRLSCRPTTLAARRCDASGTLSLVSPSVASLLRLPYKAEDFS